MVTLGVHIGHDAAAALFSDAELRYAEEEERHTGKKAQAGCPWHAIDAALAAVSARDGDVDTVALTWRVSRYVECRRALAAHARDADNTGWYERRRREIAVVYEAVEGLKSRFPKAELLDFPHHLAHLACVVGFSPPLASDDASPVLGVVADALGDAEALTVFRAPDRTRLLQAPEIVLRRSPHDSIGFFYKRSAEAFGFAGREACGYLMALSGCGEGSELASIIRGQLFVRDGGGLSWFRRAAFDPFRGYAETATRCFPEAILELLGLGQRSDDFLAKACAASAMQSITEEYLRELFEHQIAAHRPKTIFVSGGVFLNCVGLEKLASAFPEVRFVACPVKKDSGTAVGAGLLAEMSRAGGRALEKCRRTLRLGTRITGEEPAWERRGEAPSEQYERFPSTQALISSLAGEIASGRIVALVDGAGELGPRALGARSILVQPSSRSLSLRLNQEVKKRYAFQPFAGAFLEEDFRRLHPGKVADEFMSYAVRFDADTSLLEGIIHRDGSSRAQLVPPSEDSILRKLLVELSSRGAPAVVLNTSLNARGEPMPRTAADALRTCAKLGIETIYTPVGRRLSCR